MASIHRGFVFTSLLVLTPLFAHTDRLAAQCTLHESLTLKPSLDFGGTVAIDGDVIAISWACTDSDCPNQSAVHLFQKSGESWIWDAVFHSGAGDWYDEFGQAITIRGDLLVIGAPNDRDLGTSAGAAYIYRKSNGQWLLEAKVTASDGSQGEKFGSAVSVVGGRVAVGTPELSLAVDHRGAVYVFEESTDGTWAEIAKLTPDSDRADYSWFGAALASDGESIMVGAPYYPLYPGTGVVVEFREVAGRWQEVSRLNSGTGGGFGASIAWVGDLLLIGAPYENVPSRDTVDIADGAAYLFRRNGADWALEARLTAHEKAQVMQFGRTVGLGPDLAVVGTEGRFTLGIEDTSSDTDGTIHVFRRHDGVWQFESFLLPVADPAPSGFGRAMATDGHLVIAGDDGLPEQYGDFEGVYLFSLPSEDCNANGVPDAQELCDGAEIDCNKNGVPDSCDMATCVDDLACGDCNGNVVLDGCEILEPESSSSADCNLNGIPDGCDIASAVAADLDGNGVPDECDCPPGQAIPTTPPALAMHGPVAISGDWIVAGAKCESRSYLNSCEGSAFVFHRVGDHWTQFGELIPSATNVFDYFGYSVWIDGNMIVAGATCDGYWWSNQCTGAVHVFEYDGTAWWEMATLTADDDTPGGWFGETVRIDDDRIAIREGCDDVTPGVECVGSAYVFRLVGGEWISEGEIVPHGPSTPYGFGLSMWLNGDRLLVGAPYAAVGDVYEAGTVFVFDWNGREWTQTTSFTSSAPAEYERFGWSLSFDGDVVAVGMPENNAVARLAGLVIVGSLIDGTWVETARIQAPDGAAYDRFGGPVRMSGSLLAVGASGHDSPGKVDVGAVYLIRLDDGTFNFEAELTAPDAMPGAELAQLAVERNTVVATAYPQDRDHTTDTGKIYVFDRTDCNHNGTPDVQEICRGELTDRDSDGLADECRESQEPPSDDPPPSRPAAVTGCGPALILPLSLSLLVLLMHAAQRTTRGADGGTGHK